MPVTALVCTTTHRPVGDQWPLVVDVTDEDGCAVTEVPVVTVTRPDGTTALPTVETTSSGRFRALYPLTIPGRHIASATTVDYGVALFSVNAVEPTAAGAMPTVPDVNKYLGEHSHEDTAVAEALAAEADAQLTVCAVPAYYPNDLRDALMRRVQRNLSMRLHPLAMVTGDADVGSSTFLPAYDPEISRLERPHRRLLIA